MEFQAPRLQRDRLVAFLVCTLLLNPGRCDRSESAIHRLRSSILRQSLEKRLSGFPRCPLSHCRVGAKFLVDDLLARPSTHDPGLLARSADTQSQALDVPRSCILVLVL